MRLASRIILLIVAGAAFIGAGLVARAREGGDSPLDVLMQSLERERQFQRPEGGPRIIRVPRKNRPRPSPFATPTPDTPADAAQPFVPPSRFVHVFGDSLAETLTGGLTTTLKDRPDIAVTGHTKSSSGLVRDDYYDWSKTITSFLGGGEKVDAAVILIGSNDRQPIREGGETLEPHSDAWKAAYTKRVDAILALFKAKGIRTIWVGVPPMRSDTLSAEMVWFNEIYRERVERAGATYIDIWDGFVDADGSYAASGPDIDGQVARLRLGDGVNFSKAGAVVAAHFVDVDLRRALGDAPPAPVAPSQPLALATPGVVEPETPATPEEVQPAVEKPEFGPVQPLQVTEASPGGVLLGGSPAAPAKVASRDAAVPDPTPPGADPTVERLLVRGEALAPKEGRVDDFRWPRPSLARPDPLRTSSRPATTPTLPQ